MNTENWLGIASETFIESVGQASVDRFRSVPGFDGMGVHSTYLTRCRKGEFQIFDRMGITLSQVLHAEQTYHLLSPFQVGDELHYISRISDVKEKRSSNGRMIFVLVHTDFHSQQLDKVVATADSKLVIREGLQ